MKCHSNSIWFRSLLFVIGIFWICNSSQAIAAMADYCVTPPYVGGVVQPNLLLLLDNSASMYDLAYTDPATYTFCANIPSTTNCTPGATCAGTAYCMVSTTTSTATVVAPLSCSTDAVCAAVVVGDTCNTGKGQCKKATTTTTTLAYNPISCTSDATCSAITAGDTCNNKCQTTTHPCLDNTYNNANTYTGYFTPTANYCYSTKSGLTTCTYSNSWDEFDGNSTTAIPATCTYGGSLTTTPYVCVNVDTSLGGTGLVNNFVATGNFLNWLSMSKLDIEKQILTGGKYRSDRGGDLIGESRGCNGRKYIKTVTGLPLTFAVRGGTAAVGMTSQATQYGDTYIEIYNGTYNTAACSATAVDWQNVTSTSLGTVQNNTKCCIAGGTSTTGCSVSSNQLVTANQALHDCFWYFNGHGLSNMVPIENACVADWTAGNAPSTITSLGAPDAICSNTITHAPSVNDPVQPGNTMGFLGLCFNSLSGWDSNCAVLENKDFCQAIGGTGAVTDPPSNSVATTTTQNIPGFIMELGLSGMKMINDYTLYTAATVTNPTKGFLLAVYDPWHTSWRSWPPQGLVNNYTGRIRFGVMTFQNNGSASECNKQGTCSATSTNSGASCIVDSTCTGGKCVFSVPCVNTCSITKQRQCYQASDCPTGETCGPLAGTDGGVITTYVGSGNCSFTTTTSCRVDNDCPASETCIAKVGDHNSGLIRSVDDVQATSWTPLNEAFYNAIGYYARTNPYDGTNPTSRGEFNFTSLPASFGTTTTAGFNPSQSKCQKNNILIITDGMSTADQNSASEALASLYSSQTPTPYTGVSGYDAMNACPPYAGSRSLPTLAWAANNLNIKTLATSGAASTIAANAPQSSSESISTYVVYSGPAAGPDSGTTTGLCDPYRLMNTTATNGGTSLLYASSDPTVLSTKIKNALDQVAAVAASGTAASVLASGEGSGANLIQAVFYPKRLFSNAVTGVPDEIMWTGRMSNFWYYVDPFFATSSIREDDGDKILHLQTDTTHHDYITQLFFDPLSGTTKAHRWQDPLGNGVVGAMLTPDVGFEQLSNLWETGTLLWKRDVTTAAGKRKLYTTITGTSLLAGNFSSNAINPTPPATFTGTVDADNSAILSSYLTVTTTDAVNLINWVQGIDMSGYRSRTVKVESIDTIARTWKLGDIVNSTPKIVSWTPLNKYHKIYQDFTYGSTSDPKLGDPVDATHYITTQAYKNRGMIFAGGNDGMLHAFKLGQLQLSWSGQQAMDKARLVNPDTGLVSSSTDTQPNGQELWAFIPKNALPYLKYMANPAYCHVYSVDLTPVIVDASIGDALSGDVSNTVRSVSAWRTVLIGGMRFGGACRKTCTDADCVSTPTTDPLDPTKGLGYSSYFALDVTDQNNPTLLWEFSNESLGFATTGPAIVRTTGTLGGSNTNGKWFVVIGSGPTGPIQSSISQFMGHSDQSLKLFILDLKTGALLRTLDTEISIPNAFVGSLSNATIDVNLDYQDDLIYVPYIAKDTVAGTWTTGGVGRLVTKQDPNPANWAWSKLIDGIGPVVSAVSKLVDTNNHNLWVYIGTGRYYFAQTTPPDDKDNRRHLIAVKDPCFTTSGYNYLCTTTVGFNTLTDATTWDSITQQNLTPSNGNSSSIKGCYIVLDPSGSYTYPPAGAISFMAERVITDTQASTQGVVYFTSFKPFMDQCTLGGDSFIWALQYNTCGPAAVSLQGKVLIQVSTGSIEQKDLSTAFTDQGLRRTTAMQGKPPEAQGLSLITTPQPTKKIVHVKER